MAPSALARRVLNTVTAHDLVRAGDALVVHCRGDAASVGLVHALADLGPEYGFDLDLTVVHVARPLSTDPTDGDTAAALAARVAEQRGLPMRRERADAPAGDCSSAPTAAVLARVAAEVGARAAAVPTCADDRAEAVLAAVLRGALSKADLAGPPAAEPLSAEPPIALVRPLWNAWRSEIECDLQSRNIDPIRLPEPPAGDDLVRRVRDELFVHLESRYNPRIREAMLRFAESVGGHGEPMQGPRADRADSNGLSV